MNIWQHTQGCGNDKRVRRGVSQSAARLDSSLVVITPPPPPTQALVGRGWQALTSDLELSWRWLPGAILSSFQCDQWMKDSSLLKIQIIVGFFSPRCVKTVSSVFAQVMKKGGEKTTGSSEKQTWHLPLTRLEAEVEKSNCLHESGGLTRIQDFKTWLLFSSKEEFGCY